MLTLLREFLKLLWPQAAGCSPNPICLHTRACIVQHMWRNMLTLAQTLQLTLSGPPPLAAGRLLTRQLAQACSL